MTLLYLISTQSLALICLWLVLHWLRPWFTRTPNEFRRSTDYHGKRHFELRRKIMGKLLKKL